MTKLVLASTSRSRRRMLEAAGLRIECVSPGVDETVCCPLDPGERAVARAVLKADAVARSRPEAWVLGADQVVTDGTHIWGKPLDAADHLAQLQRMRGARHALVTGFALRGPGGVRHEGVERTEMTVRTDLTDEELQAYVATGEGRGCAGGYAIEGHGVWLFEAVDGDWFTILGLPLLRVLDVLRAHGWRYGA